MGNVVAHEAVPWGEDLENGRSVKLAARACEGKRWACHNTRKRTKSGKRSGSESEARPFVSTQNHDGTRYLSADKQLLVFQQFPRFKC